MRWTTDGLRGQRGISMVEVVAAIAIIAIAVVALLVNRNDRLDRVADQRRQFKAVRLARATLDEALALIRTGEKEAADYDNDSGVFEDEKGFRWTSEISEAETSEIFDDESAAPLDGVAILTVRVYYPFDDEERSVEFGSIVRVPRTEQDKDEDDEEEIEDDEER